MIFGISRRDIVRNGKLIIKVIVLLVLVFFILPSLISLVWNMSCPGIERRDEKILEKPLRVEAGLGDSP